MAVVDFPADLAALIRFEESSWHIAGGALQTEPGLDGQVQYIGFENRHWVGEVKLPALKKADAARLTALLDQISNTRNAVRFPVKNMFVTAADTDLDQVLRVLGYSAEEIAYGETFEDGETFDDGYGFDTFDGRDPVAHAAEAGASSISVLPGFWTGLMEVAGFFSHDDFLYRVAEVSEVAWSFNPPLRADIPQDAELHAVQPMIRVRLVNDPRVVVRRCRWGQPVTLRFREDFVR